MNSSAVIYHPSERKIAVLLGALAAFAPLAIDLYLPALPTIAASLNATTDLVQMSVTLFLAGFVLGMLFSGPVSDRVGRRNVLFLGIVLFALSSVACMSASSIDQLIAARFIQALGAGAVSVLSRAVARDVFPGPRAIPVFSLIAMVSAIAPLVAPLTGSGLMVLFGWRGTFGALAVWALFGAFIVWTRVPESLPPERRVQTSMSAVFAVYRRLIGDSTAIGVLLAGGASFAGMFAYITAGPFYFIELNGFAPAQYSIVFAANAFGIFLANYLNRQRSAKRGPEAMMRLGSRVALFGALGLIAATLLHAGTWLVICALFAVVSMTGLLGANGVGLLMARYPDNTGACAALFGAAQFGLDALASMAVSLMHDGSGRPMAIVIVVAASTSVLGQMVYRKNALRGVADECNRQIRI
ncbi:multidrug effflux MFS transporter [Duganella sp. Dugasp56]|uniref:multidrug effflux MFS transporter n=1 Tax=Duganella sp. Dugasp56 TaxID=3243046 RepID=UPI0039AFAB3F